MEKLVVKKAIIPAAGMGTRFLPATKAIPKEMLPIIDIPTIQYIVEEAIKSGIKDIIIVVSPSKNSIIDHFDSAYELEKRLLEKNKINEYNCIKKITNLANIHFIRQKEPLGLGHAILCAKTFINNEPFAVLLGDDVVITENNYEPALKQCINAFYEKQASIVGVQEIDKQDVKKYGIIKAFNNNGEKNIKLESVVEKPSVESAPSKLAILGRYVFTNEIFQELENVKPDKSGEIQLTDGILSLIKKQDVYACIFEGKRYDIGSKFGFVQATIDMALKDEKIGNDVMNYINKINNK